MINFFFNFERIFLNIWSNGFKKLFIDYTINELQNLKINLKQKAH